MNLNNSATNQRKRLLKKLEEVGSEGLSTIECRHWLDVLSAAPRVHELRHKQGLNIKTIWSVERTPEGNEHKVGRYVLMPGNDQSHTEIHSS